MEVTRRALLISLFTFFALSFPTFSTNRDYIISELISARIPFVKNEGQVDKKVSLYAKTFGGILFITERGEFIYSIPKDGSKVLVLKENLINAEIKNIIGRGEAITKVAYFKGKPDDWKRDITTHLSTYINDIYKGIDLEIRAYGGDVERIFIVDPGADPEKIRINIEGGNISVDEKTGELIVKGKFWELRLEKPIAYQYIGRKRVRVNVSYRIFSDNVYGFGAEKYDRSKELIINSIFIFPNLGERVKNQINSLLMDISENVVYVVGETFSTDLPPKVGEHYVTLGKNKDAFISVFTSNFENIIAFIYLGGNDLDRINTVHIDKSGNLYVAGETFSKDFPTTDNAYQTTKNGNSDAFISKLSLDLMDLLASTYLGGSGGDWIYDIFMDKSGNIYVSGGTGSTNFPTTTGAFQTANSGMLDAFISKLTPDLANLLISTYLGGNGGDWIYTISADESGNIYVAGETSSPDFPTTEYVYQVKYAGDVDAFVSKISSDLKTLIASTYIGGSSYDKISSISMDGSGNVNIFGKTASPDFPTTRGAYRAPPDGRFYPFMSKLSPDLKTLITSTYIDIRNKVGSFIFPPE